VGQNTHAARYINGDRTPGRRRDDRPDPLAPFAASVAARFGDDPHIWASALFAGLAVGRSQAQLLRPRARRAAARSREQGLHADVRSGATAARGGQRHSGAHLGHQADALIQAGRDDDIAAAVDLGLSTLADVRAGRGYGVHHKRTARG